MITFVFGIIGIITGMILTIILTRSLDPAEYGTWGLITSMIGYVIIIEPIISYWTTRDVARKKLVGKTAIFSSMTFSCGGIIIYILITKVVYFVSLQCSLREYFLNHLWQEL